MNRIVTALSVSALLGATAIGSLQAGGPPDGGYDTQSRSESQVRPDTRDSRSTAGAASGVERANEPAAGSMTRERSAAPMESMSGTEAQAARDADGRPDTLFGYPAAYSFPFADGEDVHPDRIGGEADPETAGRTVAEITGTGVSVAALHETTSEDSSE